MHNYFKQKSCAKSLERIVGNIEIIRLNNFSIKKSITSLIKNENYLSKFKNGSFLKSFKSNNQENSINSFVKTNKNKFFKISHKNFYERKSLKWYWREKSYDMLDGDIYKNYLIKFKNNFHIELIPQNLSYGKTYDSCLIWLYDGDFPEYFIEHLLEFNNFPPKVY